MTGCLPTEWTLDRTSTGPTRPYPYSRTTAFPNILQNFPEEGGRVRAPAFNGAQSRLICRTLEPQRGHGGRGLARREVGLVPSHRAKSNGIPTPCLRHQA